MGASVSHCLGRGQSEDFSGKSADIMVRPPPPTPTPPGCHLRLDHHRMPLWAPPPSSGEAWTLWADSNPLPYSTLRARSTYRRWTGGL